MTKPPDKHQRTPGKQQAHSWAVAVYWLLLVVYLIVSFGPEFRLWGINWWAHYPIWIRILLLAIGIILGLGLTRFVSSRRVSSSEPTDESAQTYLIVAMSATTVLGIAFFTFPSTTHFLGDGYQLLAQLAGGGEAVKGWDFGASATNQFVFGLLSGGNEERALSAFRLIAGVSGVACLLALVLLGLRMFPDTARRLLFFLSMATGGYMLMFFGYVENYAGLTVSVVLYSVMGVLAATDRLNRFWPLLPLAGALFFHVFGLVLVPSYLYLVLHKYVRFPNLRLTRAVRLIAVAAVVILVFVAYQLLRQNSWFLTFTLLPFWPDQFTVDGDWLFSPRHFLSVANLLLVLVPGLPIAIAALAQRSELSRLPRSGVIFQTVLGLSALALVWTVNPRLGLPRDWDLFAIVGPPLALISVWSVLNSMQQRRSAILAVSLMIAANILMLGPRVASQAVDSVALGHFRSYLQLDPVRSRNAHRLLVQYYEQQGDLAGARIEDTRAKAAYPESGLGAKGRELIGQGDLREGMRYLWRSLEINPLYSDAYGNLGYCYAQMDNLDSARLMFEICDGINPNSPGSLTNLGTLYLRFKKYDQAIGYFRKAVLVDSMATNAVSGLATALLRAGQPDESISYLERLYRRGEADAGYFRQAGDAYLEISATAQAARAYQFARELGLDSASIAEIRLKHPDLQW